MCEFNKINNWVQSGKNLDDLNALYKVSCTKTDSGTTLLNTTENSFLNSSARVDINLGSTISLFSDKNSKKITTEGGDNKNNMGRSQVDEGGVYDDLDLDNSLIDLLTGLAMNRGGHTARSDEEASDIPPECLYSVNDLSDFLTNDDNDHETTDPDTDEHQDIADLSEDAVKPKMKLTDYWNKIERADPGNLKRIGNLT